MVAPQTNLDDAETVHVRTNKEDDGVDQVCALTYRLGIVFQLAEQSGCTASDSCATDRVDTDVPLSSIQEFLEYMFNTLDEDGSGETRKSVSQVS